MSITLQINGTPIKIDKNKLNIPQLLEIQDVESPDMVSVELNGKIIRRTDFEKTIIKDNDKIEFLYFMGGGK